SSPKPQVLMTLDPGSVLELLTDMFLVSLSTIEAAKAQARVTLWLLLHDQRLLDNPDASAVK
ncbi:hypothetical protein KUCAC02_029459, partial [Chaenocephalus aceratus]